MSQENIHTASVPSKINFWSRIKNLNLKTILLEVRGTYRAGGFKAVWRRYGWKIFAAFFVYYLIRDVTLYIIMPYLVAKHLLS